MYTATNNLQNDVFLISPVHVRNLPVYYTFTGHCDVSGLVIGVHAGDVVREGYRQPYH